MRTTPPIFAQSGEFEGYGWCRAIETPVLSGELMRLALDNLADSVTIHDATGKLLYANEATARMMGMELDEVLSAPAGAWTQRFTMYDEYGEELPDRASSPAAACSAARAPSRCWCAA